MKKEHYPFRAMGHGSLAARRERRPSEAQARLAIEIAVRDKKGGRLLFNA